MAFQTHPMNAGSVRGLFVDLVTATGARRAAGACRIS